MLSACWGYFLFVFVFCARLSAELPNITGAIPIVDRAVGGVGTGAFYSSEVSNRWCVWQTMGGGGALGYTFDASRSSLIYGSSNAVTPLSLSSIFIVRY